MKTYLVGGAVRDSLMGITPKDKDYVVVGSTPEEMLVKGYKQVGADFPVFLHPATGDEYALARTEKKEYTGYCGFSSFWEGVALEEDLSRRDLTINAMALRDDPTGNSFLGQILVDPFDGQQDIKNKVLRHTTEAFAEDPVRVLRVARFLARFGPEWCVAPETFRLCQQLVVNEFESLTAERVFLEMSKALSEPHPELFFKFLRKVGEDYWFKELNDLYSIPQREDYHPEKWTFLHTMLCLKEGVKQGGIPHELFAIVCHDLGKAPAYEKYGKLHGHEGMGVPLVEDFCDRLKVPSEWRDLAKKVTYWHTYSHNIFNMRAVKVMKLFEGLDLIRKPELLFPFTLCNIADARGRGPKFEDAEYPQGVFLRDCLSAVKAVDSAKISQEGLEKGLTGEKIGAKIRQSRIKAIEEVKKRWTPPST